MLARAHRPVTLGRNSPGPFRRSTPVLLDQPRSCPSPPAPFDWPLRSPAKTPLAHSTGLDRAWSLLVPPGHLDKPRLSDSSIHAWTRSAPRLSDLSVLDAPSLAMPSRRAIFRSTLDCSTGHASSCSRQSDWPSLVAPLATTARLAVPGTLLNAPARQAPPRPTRITPRQSDRPSQFPPNQPFHKLDS